MSGLTTGYVRVYDEAGTRKAQRIQFDAPARGLIPPPELRYWDSIHGCYVTFVYVSGGSHADIAALYDVAPRTIGRWLAAASPVTAEANNAEEG